MLINQFNGGLSTRQAPQMLNINEGVVYENIDNSLGTLTPVKTSLEVQLSLNNYPFWYEAGNKWLFTDGQYVPRVELSGKVYEAGALGLVVYSPTTQRAAGVPKPSTAPIATAQFAPGRVASATLTPSSTPSATALPAGTYSYLLINKNEFGYSPGLSVQVTATGRATISINDYYPNQSAERYNRYFQDEEQSVFIGTGAFQTVTIGPVAAVIDPAYGLEVYRLFKGKHYLVGTLTEFDDTVLDNVYDISANQVLPETEFAPLRGVYQYLATHVNSEGVESAPSELSTEVELIESGSVLLSLPQIFVVGAKTRIYRVGGNLSTFSLVAEVAGTTVVYEDTLSDLDIDGRVLTSQDNNVAPVGMTSITTAYGMLFAAESNNLRYTNPGEPEYWPEAYTIPFPLPITALAPVANGLIVLTKTKTYLVTGTGPLTLNVQNLRGDIGCIDTKSMQVFQGNAIWASAIGLCVSSGNGIEVITQQKLGKVDFGAVRSSAFYNEVYYISYNSNKVLAADFRFNSLTFKNLVFAEAVSSVTFFQDSNTLYFYSNDGRKYIPFAGASYSTFKYKSPRFIEGRATENKTYKKIYFYTEGSVQLKVYINDVLVANKQTVASTKDSIELQVPQQLQRGFFIQFELSGTGFVYEIEYVAGGRQDA